MDGIVYRIDVRPGMKINREQLSELYGLQLINITPGSDDVSIMRFYSPRGHMPEQVFKRYIRKNCVRSGLDLRPGGDLIVETEGRDYDIVNDNGSYFMEFKNSAKARVPVTFG